MKNYLLLLLLLFLFSFLSTPLLFAQSTFLKVYGLHDHEIGNIGITNSSGYLIGGYSMSFTNANNPVGTLIKTDLQGNQLWSKTYATAFGSVLTYGLSETNGDYVIVGQSKANTSNSDGMIMKINAQGVIQWAKKTGSTTGNDKMLRILKSSSGDYLVSGMIESQVASGGRDMVLTKISTSGNTVWSRIWGGSQNDWVVNVIENSSGILVGGNTFSYGSGQHDFVVTQLDNNGAIQWSKVYGTSSEEQLWNINKVNNTYNVLSGFRTVNGNRRLFAIVIDNNGNTVWGNTYAVSGKSLAGRIFVANNGDLILTAYEPTNSSNSNIHLIRLNPSNGNIIWAREYAHAGFDVVNVLEEKSNGNLLVHGYTSSYGFGQRDFLMMETSSTGMVQNCNTNTVNTNNITVSQFSVTVQNINPSSSSTLSVNNLTLNENTVTTNETTICNDGVTADFTMSNNSICIGDCISVTDQSTNATQWQWSFAGGSPNSSTQQNVNQICFNTAGTYDVQLIASDGTSSDTMTQTVTVNNQPTVDLGADITICNGQSTTLDATFPNATYLWSNGATSPTLQVTTTGQYSVTVTVGSCDASDDIQITVQNNPVVNLGADTTLCDATNYILDATQPNVTYLWQDNSTQPTFDVLVSGTYSVTITDLATNCTSSDDITLTFNQSPIVDLGNDTTICEHQFLTLNATTPNAMYQWNDGSTQPILTVGQSGNYAITVTVNDCSASDDIQVDVTPTPAIDLGEDQILCNGNPILLDAFDEAALDYTWSNGLMTSDISVTETGTYSVYINYTNGCFNTDTIVIHPELDVSLDLPTDTIICSGSTIRLNAYHPNALSYQWEGRSAYHGQNHPNDTVFTVTFAGEYTITLNNGCQDISQIIHVSEQDCGCYPFIPNTFSPNLDGQNDVFKVYSSCPLDNFELMIFDRWGNQFFKSNDINDGWDGTFQGQHAENGVYVWMLRYNAVSENGAVEERVESGDVSLVR